MGGKALFLGFASSYEMETKEYLLYDFPRITAAVGGAMGLFLGISLIQALLFGIDKLFGAAKDGASLGSLWSQKRRPKTIAVRPCTFELKQKNGGSGSLTSSQNGKKSQQWFFYGLVLWGLHFLVGEQGVLSAEQITSSRVFLWSKSSFYEWETSGKINNFFYCWKIHWTFWN